MRAVVQRVSKASVKTDKGIIGKIEKGFLVLIGINKDDNEKDIIYMVEKITNLRIFPDNNGNMNLSVKNIKGDILVVSQFTLLGDCKKGRRPSFSNAMKPEKAKILYKKILDEFNKTDIKIEAGEFQAMMDVELVNCGPVTLLIDSKKDF